MHIIANCKKNGKKSEKLEKSEKAEKALDDVKDNLILCMTKEDIESMQKKKRASFVNDVKSNKNSHSSLLHTSGAAGMMCTKDRESFIAFCVGSQNKTSDGWIVRVEFI